MQTSRFQLGLIATLAVGLGFSLSSSDAVGYPAGPAVSLGTNPIWNEAGQHNSFTPKPIIAAMPQFRAHKGIEKKQAYNKLP